MKRYIEQGRTFESRMYPHWVSVMDIQFIIRNRLKRLLKRKGNFLAAEEFCGRLHDSLPPDEIVAGIDRDWTEEETTGDQKRIEDVLDTVALEGKGLLHIGVGTSDIAKRFGSRLAYVDGITISQNEVKMAEELNIDTYSVYLMNKYSRKVAELPNRYDFIVDNNPSSWSCCKFHLYLMFDNYRRLLKPGGALYTDRDGLDWNNLNDLFRMTYTDLTKIGAMLNMTVARTTDFVFTLTKDEQDSE